MTILMILGGVAALALGIWLGLPGRYDRPQEDIERALEQRSIRSKRVKRHFTPIDWFRKEERGSSRRRQQRRFRTAAPESPGTASEDEKGEATGS